MNNKPFIGIFGKRNSGKSSIINALAGQNVAIVSEHAGTTTDPVKKTIEMEGIGPVIFIDTAGIDDSGILGEKRIEKTLEALKTIDTAILIVTDNNIGKDETDLIKKYIEYNIPYILIHNKSDIEKLNNETKALIENEYKSTIIDYSAKLQDNNEAVIKALSKTIPETVYQSKTLIGDLLKFGDTVLLITPIDTEAPEGRMILPQVQVIRDVLDNDCIPVLVKENQVGAYVQKMNPKPVIAITDSQAFEKANAAIPPEIPLTSFSIVLARIKGDFKNYLKGTSYIDKLKDGDKVLVLESCSHHVTCDDIGRVKIPRWLLKHTGKRLEFKVIAGLSKLPENIHDYAFVVQCGGCMITRKQLLNRLKPFTDAGIPVSNYGMLIAYIHGVFERAMSPFK